MNFQRRPLAREIRLTRQIRTNQLCGCSKLFRRNSNPLPALRICARIVRGTPLPSGTIECRELRWADAPIAALLPGHDMKMEMRCFLPAVDPVVLEREYSERPISLDERLRDSLGRGHDGAAFLIGKIEQRRDMPSRDDATLTNLELPRIDHGERMFAFIHDRPSFFAPCHPLAQVAGISYGKFDQLPSPGQSAGRRKKDCSVRCGSSPSLVNTSTPIISRRELCQ